jgi:hypothetical protein
MASENRGWLVLCAAALGVFGLSIVVWLLRRTTRLEYALDALRDHRTARLESTVDALLLRPHAPSCSPAAAHATDALMMASPPRRASLTQSYSLRSDSPVRVATAFSDRETECTLAAVTPPGQSALVAADLATLNQTDIAYPTGSLFVVSVHDMPLTIRLAPGDKLFALGTVDDVLLSVSTAEV